MSCVFTLQPAGDGTEMLTRSFYDGGSYDIVSPQHADQFVPPPCQPLGTPITAPNWSDYNYLVAVGATNVSPPPAAHYSPTQVPEPSTFVLMLVAAGIAAVRFGRAFRGELRSR
jgi:hypothetical protein